MGDFLNIIIDDLDDIEGRFFYKNSKWDGDERIRIFLGEIFECHGIKNYRTCTFDEAKNNPNENYYYFILSLRRLQDVLDQYQGLPLKRELEHYLSENNKNINVVIYNNGEADVEGSLYGLDQWIRRKNLNPKLFWFANNNAELEDFKRKARSEINVFSSRDLGIKFARGFSNVPVEFNETKKFLFTSYNGTAKVHRYALLALMMKDGVLNETDWSLIFGSSYRELHMVNNKTEPNYNWYLPVLDVNKIIQYKEEIDELSKIEKKLTEREATLNRYYDQFDEKSFTDSCINIVTESHFIEPDVHITEKSFKPFYFYQIPIFLATKHHVKKLKERYDFDFFEDIISHAYDEVEDNRTRLSLVYNEIHKLYLNREYIKEFYVKNRHRLEENKRKILELVAKDKSEHDFFNKMIINKPSNFYFNLINFEDIVYRDLVYRPHEMGSYLSNIGGINLRRTTLDDIPKNPTENYFIIFKHGSMLHDLFMPNDDILPIPEIILESLRKYKNFKLGFYNDHENDHHYVVNYMDMVAVKNGIDPSQIYIMNNNSNIDEYKHLTNSRINTHKLNVLYKGYSFQFANCKNNEFVPVKDKFFMCHNRRRKPHRYALLCAMKKLGLLEDTDWTLLQNYAYIENNVNKSENGIDRFFYKDIFNEEDLKFYEPELRFLETFDVKKSIYEEDVTIDTPNSFESILTFQINSYRNAYVNLATESNYFNNDNETIHITEKSFIPLYFYQLPIFLASPGHVQKVREYGFDVFDDIIDHSYDKIWDTRERFFAIVKEIQRLHSIKDQIIEFYSNSKARLEHNNQVIKNYTESRYDTDYFLNLINQ